MVSALITVAVIAWCAQLALGGWQISRFNRAFDTLCQQGRVGVGRSSGRFKPAGRGRHRPGRSAAHRRHLVYERTDRLRPTAKNSRNYRYACG